MRYNRESYIRGYLTFSRNKVILKSHTAEYFIRPFSVESGYLDGDLVEAKVTRSSSEGYLAEAVVKKLIERTHSPIIGSVTHISGRKMTLEIFREYGTLGKMGLFSEKGEESVGDILEVVSDGKKGWSLRTKLGSIDDPHIDEMLLYRKSGISLEFSEKILKASEKIQKGNPGKRGSNSLIPKYIRDHLRPEYFEYDGDFPSIEWIRSEESKRLRTDFRSWWTMTIDGADAKDLDDAISIARYEDESYLLGVHIADVAEYVSEGSEVDDEALDRTTSIYTPGRVIPMLPERLSNDLCSLHPGEPKLTLSILIKLDQKGNVLATFMTEGIIESRKRGIYEEIKENDEGGRMKDKNILLRKEENLGIGGSGVETVGAKKKIENGGAERGGASFLTPETFDTFGHKSMVAVSGKIQEISENMDSLQEGQGKNSEIPFLDDFFSLFHILETRREKEGKIIFESSEPKFSSDTDGNIINISLRDRGPSHMMIEEFMVLANEEVAKWCQKYGLPFLSRVHDVPPEENAKIIHEILGISKKNIDPTDIRHFLDTLSTAESGDEKQLSWGSGVETVGAKMIIENGGAERGGASFLTPETFDTFGHKSMAIQEPSKVSRNSSLYKYSRLLLPKMAKAFYSDKPHRHFGLALEYYSHFTSPIRRYPDLQVHRIIKEYLHGTLDKNRKDHYRQILKKIAKKCSDGELRATEIERAVDQIVICRYMSDKVGETYSGRVSGLTEWAIFVELDSGVEVTIYLSRGRGRYAVDPITGTLSEGKKILHTIGDPIRVKVIAINKEERKVEGEII